MSEKKLGIVLILVVLFLLNFSGKKEEFKERRVSSESSKELIAGDTVEISYHTIAEVTVDSVKYNYVIVQNGDTVVNSSIQQSISQIHK